jgi:protein ImuA
LTFAGYVYISIVTEAVMNSTRSEVLQALAQRIREIEGNGPSRRQPPVSLGIGPVDALLPNGRLPAGSLVELLSAADGAGAWTLSLLMAKHVCGEWKVLVLVDGQCCFYPPGAAQLGIDLERSLVVRPRTRRDCLLATNQALRCRGVGAVVGWHDQLRTLDARRLQAAAEAGGGVGFVLRPLGALRAPSFANLRLRLSPLVPRPSSLAPRLVRVDVVRCRGGRDGQSVLLEIGNEPGDVRALSEVAPSTAPARKARRSG